jgi:hypothetical protein
MEHRLVRPVKAREAQARHVPEPEDAGDEGDEPQHDQRADGGAGGPQPGHTSPRAEEDRRLRRLRQHRRIRFLGSRDRLCRYGHAHRNAPNRRQLAG